MRLFFFFPHNTKKQKPQFPFSSELLKSQTSELTACDSAGSGSDPVFSRDSENVISPVATYSKPWSDMLSHVLDIIAN